VYSELYDTWQQEHESADLTKLQLDFYQKVASYVRLLKEESRMLDKRTAKAALLKKEMQNVKRMIRALTKARYRKLVRMISEGEKLPTDVLTAEEEKVYLGVVPFADAYRSIAESVLHGHAPEIVVEQKHKRAVLRFLKDVPAIIGADMATFGPFKVEDVASLPLENAKILVKQGLAERIEV
jgi:DNA replication factor GINS